MQTIVIYRCNFKDALIISGAIFLGPLRVHHCSAIRIYDYTFLKNSLVCSVTSVQGHGNMFYFRFGT